jgi:hypothetical protein
MQVQEVQPLQLVVAVEVSRGFNVQVLPTAAVSPAAAITVAREFFLGVELVVVPAVHRRRGTVLKNLERQDQVSHHP